jgi:P-type conjugative transfer protein TrbJ
VLAYVRQLYQLQQEIQTAQNTLNFYLNLVQNTASLPATVFQNISSDIARIEGIAQQANLLMGNAGAMIGNLSATAGYPASVAYNWQQQILAENNAVALAMQRAAAVLNLQPAMLTNGAAVLAALQSQAISSDGWQKTLQTLAGVNATIGQQIQSGQAATTAAMQAMMTAQLAIADRQALTDEAVRQDLQRARQGTCAALAATGVSSNACSGGAAAPAAGPYSGAYPAYTGGSQ